MPFDDPFLTRRQRDDLPDSSFALILTGGRKDAEGKTMPRSLRLFPYRDSSGGLIGPEARQSLRELNESRLMGVETRQKVAAWNKIVKAISDDFKKADLGPYFPPPRKF